MWKPLTKEEYEKYISSKPKPVLKKRLTYDEYVEKNKKKEIELIKSLEKNKKNR